MRDEELEDLLRDDGVEPGSQVERTVLGHYDAAFGRRGFWRKSVPLYQAAASLVLVAGLALAAGRLAGSDPARDMPAPLPVEAAWVTAAPDILVGN